MDALLLGLGAALLWGFHDFTVRIIGARVNPLVLLAGVFLTGVVVLAPLTLGSDWGSLRGTSLALALLAGVAYTGAGYTFADQIEALAQAPRYSACGATRDERGFCRNADQWKRNGTIIAAELYSGSRRSLRAHSKALSGAISALLPPACSASGSTRLHRKARLCWSDDREASPSRRRTIMRTRHRSNVAGRNTCST